MQKCKSLINYISTVLLFKSNSGHPVKWNKNNYPFDEEPGEPSGDMV